MGKPNLKTTGMALASMPAVGGAAYICGSMAAADGNCCRMHKWKQAGRDLLQ